MIAPQRHRGHRDESIRKTNHAFLKANEIEILVVGIGCIPL
jgi:hypothetical protein